MKFEFIKAGFNAGQIADALKAAGLGNFKANLESDVVNGHVTVRGDHIEIVAYEQDEPPSQDHKSAFKARAQDKALIESAVNALQ